MDTLSGGGGQLFQNCFVSLLKRGQYSIREDPFSEGALCTREQTGIQKSSPSLVKMAENQQSISIHLIFISAISTRQIHVFDILLIFFL